MQASLSLIKEDNGRSSMGILVTFDMSDNYHYTDQTLADTIKNQYNRNKIYQMC